jgi:hypothetical protein
MWHWQGGGAPRGGRRHTHRHTGGIYTMELAADAMRGHMSAHSFATGPVMAEPFISPLGFTITPALSSK